MKIVIDIPEYVYKICQGHKDIVYQYIANGTPITKNKTTINSTKTTITDRDLISRQAVITMLNKIENAVEDGDGFQFNEWIDYAKDIPAENIDGDLISRKAVLDCIGMTSLHYDLARRLRKLPTIPQTDSVLEDIIAEIRKEENELKNYDEDYELGQVLGLKTAVGIVYQHISRKEYRMTE